LVDDAKQQGQGLLAQLPAAADELEFQRGLLRQGAGGNQRRAMPGS
jgi:hypothetical protein